ncbi:hypothetical protein GEOBRER4_n0858 [Citrifermentans bremense]|uniref:Outer membrane cytochrome MtrC/MtrF-like domain-containing protein n=1 Tax=Citrifermentans bremense TaxID=60035 RepID=A0A6S6LVQ1_9BACT|nr:cytochrome c3 family protein [Citrifermentans bremense]BCG46077.1 hypothetical protein GEOBRER4_n0858 [Citrifermentans bremense]
MQFNLKSFFAVSLLAGALAMSGCSGDDGATGATGATGPQGPAGPVTLTQQSCVVCHSAGDEADQVAMHGFVYDAATGTRFLKPRSNDTDLALSAITVAADATSHPVINFTVKKGSTALTAVTAADVRIYIGTIVPAGTATDRGTFDNAHIETWAYATGADLTLTNLGNGNYSAVVANVFGTPTAGYRNANYDPTLQQRVIVRVNPSTAMLGTSVINVNNGVGVVDLTAEPAANTAAVLEANPQNQIVTVDACKKCHGAPLLAAAHGNPNGYRNTLVCVMCHSPLYHDPAAPEINFTKFIHEIHAAKDVAEFPTRIFGGGYTQVTYPRPLGDCVACHSNPAGVALGTGDKLANYKVATLEACGSCHNSATFDLTTGAGHVGGAQVNSAACALCHPTTAIDGYHTPAPAAKDVREYNVTMTLDAPANGTHYVTGETPKVTVTLKNKSDNSAVAGTVYTTAKDAVAVAGGGLSKAQIYVYGPRSNAKPVLTKAAATLTNGVPKQAQPLFVDATDANIQTTSAGFVYKLNPVTADMSGTYFVRATIADYGYKADSDYKIDSTAFQTIQINTATAEQKISGNTCVDCHGPGLLEAHNARHSVVFNTDECISCHDKSGNYADPLDNRVHAIHSASATGDKHGIDWKDVSYPQGLRSSDTATVKAAGAPRCSGCHTGTSGVGVQWKTSISQNSCAGCHADKPGATDHFLQNGGR